MTTEDDGWDDTTCANCGEGPRDYPDPREIPADRGDCLCRDCYESALDERVWELEDELADLRAELNSLREDRQQQAPKPATKKARRRKPRS